MTTKKLFCFPFAGGDTLSYRGLGSTIGAAPVATFELPGRGRRIREPLLTDLEHMVDDLLSRIQPDLHGRFGFYGHSMGGLLAYLLTKRLLREMRPLPDVLFVSGCKGPAATRSEQRHLLPRHAFRDMLRGLGGFPPEILADAQFMDFYEPVLRADFSALAGYRYEQTAPLQIPIVALAGSDDSIDEDDVRQWQRETSRPLDLVSLRGEHFFIFQHWPEIRQLFAGYLDDRSLRW